MKHVQQTKMGECQLCCVAMLTGMTLEEAAAKVRLRHNLDDNVSYLPDRDAAIFLLQHGFSFGLQVQGIKHWDINWSVDGFHTVNALLGVRSQANDAWTHAVVWDAEIQMVRDPWKPEPQRLTDYEIFDWTPIQRMGTALPQLETPCQT